MDTPQVILERYSVEIEDKIFVDIKMLEFLSDSNYPNKLVRFTPIVESIINGTGIKLEDVIKKSKKYDDHKWTSIILIARGIMQLVVVGGFKGFPWTDKRVSYVTHFFGPSLLPTHNVYGKPAGTTTAVPEENDTAAADKKDLHGLSKSTGVIQKKCVKRIRNYRRQTTPTTMEEFAKFFRLHLVKPRSTSKRGRSPK